MSNDANVQEATEALKGMLGIGSPVIFDNSNNVKAQTSNFTTPNKDKSRDKDKSKDNPNNEQTTKPSAKGKKQNKNKKTQQQQQQQQQFPQQPSQQQQATPQKGKGNKNKNKKKPAKEENFAWSAFQSSPDASKLPIPAFSPAEPRTILSDRISKQDNPLPPTPSMIPNIPTAEQLEQHLFNASLNQQQQRQNQQPTNLTGSPTSTQPNPPDKPPTAPEDEPLASATGINLAAKIKSSSSPKLSSGFNADTPKGSDAPLLDAATLISPPPLSTNQTYSMHTPPHHIPEQHQHQHQHQQHHSQHPANSLPPGYMILQVQVPMQLGLDRRIIVPTPSGFPLHVQVPPGVPPGAILPVQVPTVPFHMMPPPPPVPQSQQHAFVQQPRSFMQPPPPPQQQQQQQQPPYSPYSQNQIPTQRPPPTQ